MSLNTGKVQTSIMNLIERVQLSDPINIADIGVASINETPASSDLLIGGYGYLLVFDGDSRQIPAPQKLYGEHATFLNPRSFLGRRCPAYGLYLSRRHRHDPASQAASKRPCVLS